MFNKLQELAGQDAKFSAAEEIVLDASKRRNHESFSFGPKYNILLFLKSLDFNWMRYCADTTFSKENARESVASIV